MATRTTVSAVCYPTIAKKVSSGIISEETVNASNYTKPLPIIILIIILADSFVKLKIIPTALLTNTGVTLIAHANASLKFTLTLQHLTLLRNGTVTNAVSTLLRTWLILAHP